MTADLSPIWLSIETSVTATVITFVLGTATAVWRANKHGAGPALIDGIFLLPLVLPPTVVGFILLLVFGFGGYRMGPGIGYYGGGGISLILLILIVLLLLKVI